MTRAPTRALARLRALSLAWLDAYLPVVRHRRPPVGIELGPWLPAWSLRLLPAVAVAALSLLIDGGPIARLAALAVAAAIVAWPSGPAPATAVVGYAVLLATAPEPPSPLVAAVLIAVLPAVLQIGAVLGRSGLLARVELAVLVPALPRYLAIQLVVQPLALAGQWLADSGQLSGARWIALPMLAVVGLIVLSFGWLPRLRPQPDPGSPTPSAERPPAS